MTIDSEEYQEQILSFARQAKGFFEETEEKRIEDEFDKEMYESFWAEFNGLVDQHG